METKKCYVCGKSPLSKDEVGITKKLIDKKTTNFYCLTCLAEYFEVDEEELIAKMLGSLQAPISNFVGVLSAMPRSLVIALNAVAEKKAQ